MIFSLINVYSEKDGLVSGCHLQLKVGTLESATKFARETEAVNSNKITVAVVAEHGSPLDSMLSGLKRLDVCEKPAPCEAQAK